MKYICQVFNGDSIKDEKKSDFESGSELDLPYISTKDVDFDNSKIDYDNGLRIPLNNKKFKIAPTNSFLLCIEGGSAGKKIGFLTQDVCFVNKLACFKCEEKSDPKYLYYFVNSLSFQSQFHLSMTGLIGGVAISLIRNFNSFLPPKNEQVNISHFLDCKIAFIYQAIGIKEKQIDLLKEQRQILIHKAVTRGLNPNVKMKDTTVEWIGEMPEHWEVISNRGLFEERNEPGNESLQLLSVSIHTAVSSEELSDDENLRGKIRIDDKRNYKRVKPNDIAFNMMRAWQGAIGAVRVDGMVSPAYIVAKPKKEVNSDYLEYLFRTMDFICQMDRYSKGITDFRKRLYWNEFKQLKVILPPMEEQNSIVKHISVFSGKISKAVSFKEQEIENLKSARNN